LFFVLFFIFTYFFEDASGLGFGNFPFQENISLLGFGNFSLSIQENTKT
jgi:hypothetical protein